MPISPEHLSALRGYELLWRSDATDADIEAAFAPGFRDHRPGAELFGIPPAGRHVSFTETHIVRLRGERVCEHWLQVDLLGLLNQLHA